MDPQLILEEQASIYLVPVLAFSILSFIKSRMNRGKSVRSCWHIFKIQCLKKKDTNSQKFTREDKKKFELDKSDAVFKMPDLFVTGGPARQLEKLSFGINFDHLNLE